MHLRRPKKNTFFDKYCIIFCDLDDFLKSRTADCFIVDWNVSWKILETRGSKGDNWGDTTLLFCFSSFSGEKVIIEGGKIAKKIWREGQLPRPLSLSPSIPRSLSPSFPRSLKMKIAVCKYRADIILEDKKRLPHFTPPHTLYPEFKTSLRQYFCLQKREVHRSPRHTVELWMLSLPVCVCTAFEKTDLRLQYVCGCSE